jgi:hypothetical protein
MTFMHALCRMVMACGWLAVWAELIIEKKPALFELTTMP